MTAFEQYCLQKGASAVKTPWWVLLKTAESSRLPAPKNPSGNPEVPGGGQQPKQAPTPAATPVPKQEDKQTTGMDLLKDLAIGDKPAPADATLQKKREQEAEQLYRGAWTAATPNVLGMGGEPNKEQQRMYGSWLYTGQKMDKLKNAYARKDWNTVNKLLEDMPELKGALQTGVRQLGGAGLGAGAVLGAGGVGLAWLLSQGLWGNQPAQAQAPQARPAPYYAGAPMQAYRLNLTQPTAPGQGGQQ